ncbi:MAG: D-alanyl-D-alanine carboxypeptidase [Peptococcaceae bacterium]|nr:D-alanyl-D-alanine carboxypeptidase [Peptococcaceae bacterium]
MSQRLFRVAVLFLCVCLVYLPLGHTAQPSLPAMALALALRVPQALLMDMGTGTILLARDEHERKPIASLTKIMTMLLVFEAIETERIGWDDVVRISSHAAQYGGSQIWLKEGETLTVEQLFLAVAIVSANDAAVALGEFVAGSEPGFVALMNDRAQQLGMQNTKFTTACGLDIGGAYSSAYDVALMTRALLHHERVHDYSAIRLTHLQRAGLRSMLANTNRHLLTSYPGYDGLKTGWTTRAGWCLSATAKRGGLRLIAVVLGGTSPAERNTDIVRLLDYGFATYEGRRVVERGQEVGAAPIDKGTLQSVKVHAREHLDILKTKGNQSVWETKREFFIVEAPVHVGQIVGRFSVLKDGNVVASVDLLATQTVPRAPAWIFFHRLWRRLLN